MSDLTQRLRDNPLWPTGAHRSLTEEAADEIDRLKSVIVEAYQDWDMAKVREEAMKALSSQPQKGE